ncbi:HET-domain-containing protein [Hypoxylon sp. FL1150]|nr:HET-domain-containing protein [Hypoxylon sp. FL1150]
MRLLNTDSGDIELFFGEDTPHEYAILSHRWGGEEISYQDWLARSSRPDIRSRDGYEKIQHCCEQAKADGFNWVWIDTCCIDKTSSQELSEAINSMFQWYRGSAVCYAYLRDYDNKTFDAACLKNNEWFFRGWTLQELVAPRNVIFYNKHWQRFGSKSDQDVCEAISRITKIDVEFLLGSDLEYASIAKRMSWASRRKTTRVEDTAYCLMGLFDINMPLLYGEGVKAFKRLQEEIMKQYPTDHSLYAWGIPVDSCSIEIPPTYRMIQESIDDPLASDEPLPGFLARSPKDFEYSRNYSPIPDAWSFYSTFWTDNKPASYASVVGKGISIELPISKIYNFFYMFTELSVLQAKQGNYAMLLCKDDTNEDVTLSIPLLACGSGRYGRSRELLLNRPQGISQTSIESLLMRKSTFTATPEKRPKLKAGDIIIRSLVSPSSPANNVNYYVNTEEKVSVDWDNVIHFQRDLSVRGLSLEYGKGETFNWTIVVGRVQTEDHGLPAFQAGIVSTCGPDINHFREAFISDKVFQSPFDEFTSDLDDLHEMKMRVHRRQLPNESGFVDIMDVAIYKNIMDVAIHKTGQTALILSAVRQKQDKEKEIG